MIAKLCYSLAEVTEISGISRSGLYRLIQAGSLRALKVGTRTVINAEDLNAWLASLPVAKISSYAIQRETLSRAGRS